MLNNMSPSSAIKGTQFGGFVLVGLVSTICNLSSRYVFEVVSNYEIALIGANAVGVLSAFLLNRWLVFEASGTSKLRELYRFTLVNLAGIVVGWFVAVILYRYVFPFLDFAWHPDFVAHAVGITVPVVPNYLLHRHWTFGKP
jgi:putative flippase GtrA